MTIYTVAYNAEKFIKQTIESVLAQTFTDFEYILVNDGSTDGTGKIMHEYFGDERVRYLLQGHSNFATGMNLVIYEANGEYIMGVDADDYISETYLEEMMKTAEMLPHADYIYPSHFHEHIKTIKPKDNQSFINFFEQFRTDNF